MARKTFISYKYSEARGFRDRIIEALGDDAQFYKGETADSPDRTDQATETIKEALKDMIWETSVTIVIATPNMTESKWIDWEISYSLKEITREDKTSHANGVVIVAAPDTAGSYEWILKSNKGTDGCTYTTIQQSNLYDIINNNMFNEKEPKYSCEVCKTVNRLSGHYMSIIPLYEFLGNPDKFIENAYEKAQNISEYKIVKEC